MRKRQIEQMVDYDINEAELENIMDSGVTLDFETANAITLCCLKEQMEYLKSEQDEIESMDSVPGYKQADYFANREIMAALKKVIEYYGG